MASSLVGVEFIDLGLNADPAAANVTVPAGANAVVLVVLGYNNTGTELVDSLTCSFATLSSIRTENGSGDNSINSAHGAVTATGAQTVTVSWNGAGSGFLTELGALVCLYIDADDSGDFFRDDDADVTTYSESTGAPAATVSSETTDLVVGLTTEFSTTPGTPTGCTSAGTSATIGSNGIRAYTVDAPGSPTTTVTSNTEDFPSSYAVSIKSVAATQDQEGFRFGTDDGNEASHGWVDAQDTNVTQPLSQNLLLRALINATLDPASAAYTLRAQKNGAGGYVAVPVGASFKTQPVIEVGDVTESGNNTASGSWAISHPAASAGDLLIFCFGWDDSTTTTDLTAPAGPNGETISTIVGPTASSATSVRGKCFYTVATGSWSATTLAFTPSASEQWTGVVIRVPAGEFDSTTPIGASNSLASTTTGNPNTPTLTAGASDGTGTLVAWLVADVDDPDGTMTGWTGLSSVDRGAVGADLHVRDAAVTDSESISSSTGLTVPTARDWVSFNFVVRAPTTINEVYVATSANIAAGGEDTTARLTAPSGKTTGDFVTGRRWDNENGSDSLDITTDDYTEVEWCLQAQSPASNGDFYDFRVYAGANALSTYTVTPRWTIGTPGGSTRGIPFGGRGTAFNGGRPLTGLIR